MGSTAAARRAGTSDAPRLTQAMTPAAAAKNIQSPSADPYNRCDKTCEMPMASTMPTAEPVSATITPSRTIERITRPRPAKRQANPDFLRAPRHGTRQRAVEPNGRQQNGKPRRVADEERAYPNGTGEGSDACRKRNRLSDRHVWVDAMHRPAQLGDQYCRVASGPNRKLCR